VFQKSPGSREPARGDRTSINLIRMIDFVAGNLRLPAVEPAENVEEPPS